MFKNTLLVCSACLVLLSGNYAWGSDCIKIKGKISTTVQDLNDPSTPVLGVLTIRTRGDRKICGIQGQIVGVNEYGLPKLEHKISCNDHDNFNTADSVKKLISLNDCEFYVKQVSLIEPVSGEYEGYMGKIKIKGTINQCTGENEFKYKGKLCYEY